MGDLSGPGQEVTITLGMAKVNSTLSTVLSWPLGQEKGGSPHRNGHKQERPVLDIQTGLFNLIPAVTYVPTQLPVQYHRPGEA